MFIHHLNQNQLAERWNVSPRTLERWRWLGQGPVYLKLGGRVSYRLEDIEQYEANRLHANTNGPLPVGPTNTQALL
jgi:predicted site-specific integrase-resolvase